MSNSQSQRTIVVTGATSRQGRGVVKALLSDTSAKWIVRGVTTDPDTDWAKKLVSELQTEDNRLSLVKASAFDVPSLVSAFTGAYGVFAMTDPRVPDSFKPDEASVNPEVQAGYNLVEAAKQAGVAHFIFSSVPSLSEASGGRLTKVFHFDNKQVIEKRARAELPGFSSLILGFFYNNLDFPIYTRLQADGVTRFCLPIPEDQPLQWADPTVDAGTFAAKIFALDIQETNGKTYHALSPQITNREMAEIFTRVTGKKSIASPISAEEFSIMLAGHLGDELREGSRQMIEWIATAPKDQVCYGTVKPGAEGVGDLGIEGTTFEDWLRRSGWTGPTEVFGAAQ